MMTLRMTKLGKLKKKTDSECYDAIEDINHTPKKIMSESNIMCSSSGNWKVTQDTRYIHKSISVNTFQDKVDLKSTKYTSSITDPNLNKLNTVKRQLHYVENTKQIAGIDIENKFIATVQRSNETILTSIKDFQKMFLTSYAHMKHEIQSLMYLCQTTNDNVEKLMKEKSFTTPIDDHANIIETFFPIKSEEDLEALEKKLNDTLFKASLVGKIALFIGNKDFGNSVRRIMIRLFDDNLLENYSLYGLKKKKSFSSLSCYRLIIHALRTHLKYKHTTKKINDIPLGTWLSHTPFRLKAKNKVEEQKPLYKN